jgi:ADP-heptose:LPS heptosyltransferase
MSNKKKIKKQQKDSQKKITNPISIPTVKSKYPFAVYKTYESRTLALPYGNITIPNNEKILCPHTLPIQKELHFDLNKAFKIYNKNNPNIDLNNKKILISRYGGLGDICCSLFGISELKRKFNNLYIGFMGSPTYIEILRLFPSFIDELVLPIENYNNLKKFDYMCVLDNVIENSEEYNTKTLQEHYSEEMNIKNINKETLDNIINNNLGIINNKINGIGIHYSSGSPIRNYNLDKFIELIKLIGEKYNDTEIYLLGYPDDYVNVNYIQSKLDGKIKLIPNGCGFKKLNIIDTVKLISRLEMVIGIDSAMLHIAGICGTKVVGLFGPFPSNLRLSFYNADVLDGSTDCSPCFRHWPENFCPYTGGEGSCINNISPELIFERVSIEMDR